MQTKVIICTILLLSGKIIAAIRYLAENYRINGCFLSIAVPVYQEFQTSELGGHRVAGKLIKTVYPEIDKKFSDVCEN